MIVHNGTGGGCGGENLMVDGDGGVSILRGDDDVPAHAYGVQVMMIQMSWRWRLVCT